MRRDHCRYRQGWRALTTCCIVICCTVCFSRAEPWPYPLEKTITGSLLYVSPRAKLEFETRGWYSDILERAFERYRDILQRQEYHLAYEIPVVTPKKLLKEKNEIRKVVVYVQSYDQSLGLQTSETYSLRIAAPSVVITSQTLYGALRGLETLAQSCHVIRYPEEDNDDGMDIDIDDNNGQEGTEGEGKDDILGGEISILLGGIQRRGDVQNRGDVHKGGDGILHYDPDGRNTYHKMKHHHHHKKKHHHHHDKKYLIVLNETAIYDSPRFRHRGVLIDTARHFLPVDTIKTHLDAMVMTKMNVLHWHMTDDESFPFMSFGLPELAEKGAFSSKTIYTPEDVQDIIEYARYRGIRVIPEFDSPGHAGALAKSHPEVMLNCTTSHEQKGYPIMSPAKEQTYSLLWKLFREISRVFADINIHLGGDEIDSKCWLSDQTMRSWMSTKSFGGDTKKALTYHMQRLMGFSKALGKVPIVWQEVYDASDGRDVSDDTIVHVWKWKSFNSASSSPAISHIISHHLRSFAQSIMSMFGTEIHLAKVNDSPDDTFWLQELRKITETHRAIVSAPWYVNLATSGIGSWKRYWSVEPLDFHADIDQKDRVLGGEAAVWGETIDETNSIQATWPLAASVGERLWSSSTLRDEEDAIRRFGRLRCRMLARGIKAAPTGPGECEFFEPSTADQE